MYNIYSTKRLKYKGGNHFIKGENTIPEWKKRTTSGGNSMRGKSESILWIT